MGLEQELSHGFPPLIGDAFRSKAFPKSPKIFLDCRFVQLQQQQLQEQRHLSGQFAQPGMP